MQHRRLIVLLVLTALGAAVAAGVALPRGSTATGAAETATPLPAPSASFSTVWMSTVCVDRQGSRYDIQAGTVLVDRAGNVLVHESYDAMGRSSAMSAYDAAAHALTSAQYGEGRASYRRSPDVSPDTGMRMSAVSPFEYVYSAAAAVRAAVADHDPAFTARSTTCIGRAAWQASYTWQGWKHTTTVDKATGFPLRYVLADIRSPVTHRYVWRVIDLATDMPAGAGGFSIAIPEGARVETTTGYEHFAAPDELAGSVGYQPFVPSVVPEGSALAASSTQPDPWGPYTWFFPISFPWTDYSKLPDNQVRLYYHRGFDWFTITERPLKGGIGNSATRELDKRKGYAYRKSVLPLQTGAFAGMVARTWVGDGFTLYVQDRTWAIEICGDLTRSELLAIAASLER